MSKKLNWSWDGALWSAYSAAHDDATPFRWVINVMKNGSFGISHSTPELAHDKEFPSLQAAQDYCQQFEDDVSDMVDDILWFEGEEAKAASKPVEEASKVEVSTCKTVSDEASNVVRMELEIRFPAKDPGVRFRVTPETVYIEPDDQPKITIRKLED